MIAIPEPSRSFGMADRQPGRIIRLWNRLLRHVLERVPQTTENAFSQSPRRQGDLERALDGWASDNGARPGSPQSACPQDDLSAPFRHALDRWDNEGGAQPERGTRS
jgi:hypothetical protein